MNHNEKLIRDQIELTTKVKQGIRDELKEKFYAGYEHLGRMPRGFFDKIEVDVNGEKHKVYRGHYELAMRAVREQRLKLLEGAKQGRRFALKMMEQIK